MASELVLSLSKGNIRIEIWQAGSHNQQNARIRLCCARKGGSKYFNESSFCVGDIGDVQELLEAVKLTEINRSGSRSCTDFQ